MSTEEQDQEHSHDLQTSGSSRSLKCGYMTLGQWFSTFLMLGPFDTTVLQPHVVLTLNHKIILVATS